MEKINSMGQKQQKQKKKQKQKQQQKKKQKQQQDKEGISTLLPSSSSSKESSTSVVQFENTAPSSIIEKNGSNISNSDSGSKIDGNKKLKSVRTSKGISIGSSGYKNHNTRVSVPIRSVSNKQRNVNNIIMQRIALEKKYRAKKKFFRRIITLTCCSVIFTTYLVSSLQMYYDDNRGKFIHDQQVCHDNTRNNNIEYTYCIIKRIIVDPFYKEDDSEIHLANLSSENNLQEKLKQKKLKVGNQIRKERKPNLFIRFGNLLGNSIPEMYYYKNTKIKRVLSSPLSSSAMGQSNDTSISDSNVILLNNYGRAWSLKDVELSSDQIQKITQLGNRAVDNINDFIIRSNSVQWGGGGDNTDWLDPPGNTHDTLNPLSKLQGGYLLHTFLTIMKWPTSNVIKFPFRLCANGCPTEAAINHTLQFREHYKPWCITPNTIKENPNGWVYQRGFTKQIVISDQQEKKNKKDSIVYSKQAMVWIRLGQHTMIDKMSYFRVILNALEMAITENLIETKYQNGKFNIVIDASEFSMSKAPSLKQFKQVFGMLQDHFPNRLGMLMMVNLSWIAETVVKLILPLCAKGVREKVKILSGSDEKRLHSFIDLMGSIDHVPDWLGGNDTYKFNKDTYYGTYNNDKGTKNKRVQNHHHLSTYYHYCNDSIEEDFVNSMPYHAE